MSEDLIRGHRRFRSAHAAGAGDFLRRLAAEQQSPDALYVGCSDSRIVPELLTSSTPGQLFVIRNIANRVPPRGSAAPSVGAALEYAISRLGIRHVIVCGHDGCGGVQAALDGLHQFADLPALCAWLDDLAEPAARARAAGGTAEEIYRRAVEENVIRQLDHLLTFPVVDDALGRGALQLHGWVYDPRTLDLRVYDIASDRFLASDALLRR
jgi:carbonic anhydrase